MTQHSSHVQLDQPYGRRGSRQLAFEAHGLPQISHMSTRKPAKPSRLRNAMTIDVEDYFQVSAFERYVDRADWANLPSRVEANTSRILDMLEEADIKATFFILGWVAVRFPGLVERMVRGGHEIASHGWDHIRVTELSPAEFEEDVSRARKALEDIAQAPVVGYRAPSYSFNHTTPWAHDILANTGHLYSSSVAPVAHDIYGMPEASRFAHTVAEGRLLEVPITTTTIAGKNRMCAGGGWFRLYPYQLSRVLLNRVNQQESQSCVFYFHPWEIDPKQPRISGLDSRTRFRHYLNLDRIQTRLSMLFRDFSWDRMDRVFATDISQLTAKHDGRMHPCDSDLSDHHTIDYPESLTRSGTR